MSNTTSSRGVRKDTGKNRIDLVPAEWVWALATVMTAGAEKYDARNWEGGMAWGRVIGSCFRHLLKFMAGERYDEETKCHHLAMVAWNALALMTYDLHKLGDDDRGIKTQFTEVTDESS